MQKEVGKGSRDNHWGAGIRESEGPKKDADDDADAGDGDDGKDNDDDDNDDNADDDADSHECDGDDGEIAMVVKTMATTSFHDEDYDDDDADDDDDDDDGGILLYLVAMVTLFASRAEPSRGIKNPAHGRRIYPLAAAWSRSICLDLSGNLAQTWQFGSRSLKTLVTSARKTCQSFWRACQLVPSATSIFTLISGCSILRSWVLPSWRLGRVIEAGVPPTAGTQTWGSDPQRPGVGTLEIAARAVRGGVGS